jgi:hypothetical protein
VDLRVDGSHLRAALGLDGGQPGGRGPSRSATRSSRLARGAAPRFPSRSPKLGLPAPATMPRQIPRRSSETSPITASNARARDAWGISTYSRWCRQDRNACNGSGSDRSRFALRTFADQHLMCGAECIEPGGRDCAVDCSMQQGSSDFLDSNPVVEYAFNVQLDLACPAAQGVRIATPTDDALLGVEVDLVYLDLGGTVFEVISPEGVSVDPASQNEHAGYRASTSASNSRVMPESLPNQSGSIWTTARRAASLEGSDLQVAFMLEEVEVPQRLGLGVIDRMHTFDTRRREPAPGDEVDADRQDLSRRVKINTPDVPRFGNAERGFKQLILLARVGEPHLIRHLRESGRSVLRPTLR